ncbi:translocation protein Sec62-domain-containing protein [Lipomyces arxii]|uniref:translocation protein Sec62-domain-containing protein n=1 Tax=Lipomyces arxii TaxID=56418 RepID=UPI0034CE5224
MNRPEAALAKSPTSLAIASFLRHNAGLKMRQGILNGKRQDFFRCKRGIRALMSPAYGKACKKNALLPAIETEDDAIAVFRELPMNQLAIRVERLTRSVYEEKKKQDPNAPLPPVATLSKVKGEPTLIIVRDQVVSSADDIYYVWMWENVPLTTYLYAGLFAIAIFTVVLFPLWPPVLRRGVWYLSVGMLCLLGAFFAMAIFRLVLFGVTYFVASPGLWLFPNLFEDVGFVDSFIPFYAWNVKPERKSKKAKKAKALKSEDKEGVKEKDKEGVKAKDKEGVKEKDKEGVKRSVTLEDAE